MKNCHWERIEEFQSINEFNQFLNWLKEQINSGSAEEMPIKKHYIGASTFNEKWIRCKDCNQVWRLVASDPPFAGIFEQVTEPDVMI